MFYKSYLPVLLAGMAVGVGLGILGWMSVGGSSGEVAQTDESSSASEAEQTVVSTAQVDLNADGVADEIALSMEPGSSPFSSYYDNDPNTKAVHPVLIINHVILDIIGENPLGYFDIVDLNVSDNQHEVALSDSGAGGNYTTSFYTWTGAAIQFLGTVQGLCDQMEWNGDGSFITTTRGSILDTWFYRDTFALADNQTIVRVPKDFYERLRPAEPLTVLTTLPLQQSPEDSTIVMILRKDDVVTMVGCDDVAWCEVKNEDEETGWFAVHDFNVITGVELPATEVFDGLSSAD